MIIVGSAGSGKTALILEKMKTAEGDILYVTRSPFLARHARDLYYAHGYQAERQNVEFLPSASCSNRSGYPKGGRSATGSSAAGCSGSRRCGRGLAHPLYEECKGVSPG